MRLPIMTEKITDKLANKLKEEKNLQKFFSENENDFKEGDLKNFLENLLETKHLNKTEVIKNSGLDKSYAYKIFSGEKKNPARTKVLALALSMQLNEKETNHLLWHACHNALYPRNRWDSIIIYSLKEHLNVLDTNLLLLQYGETEILI